MVIGNLFLITILSFLWNLLKHAAAVVKGKKGLGKKLSALERTTQEGEALLKVTHFTSTHW